MFSRFTKIFFLVYNYNQIISKRPLVLGLGGETVFAAAMMTLIREIGKKVDFAVYGLLITKVRISDYFRFTYDRFKLNS